MNITRACRLGLLIIVPLLVAFEAESRQPACEEGSAWSEPVNLGPVVNSSFLEQNATLSRSIPPSPRVGHHSRRMAV